MLGATVDAAEKAVAKTPSLLAILREAGVVDSGGQGLYRLFQGALLHLTGRTPVGSGDRSPRSAGPKPSTLVAHADEGYGYETMFLLRAEATSRSTSMRSATTSSRSANPSSSPAMRGPSRSTSTTSDRTSSSATGLGSATSAGSPSRTSTTRPRTSARRARPSSPGRRLHRRPRRASLRPGVPAGDLRQAATAPGPTSDLPSLAVIAVTAGEGLAAIFRDFGVASVVEGGQSSNPSTGELLEAVGKVEAREVLLLPNNPNVVLAARQVASMSERPVQVVPTRNAAEGFAALLALDPGMDAAANVGPMTEAGRAIQSIVVTEAVRDATIGGKKVKRGQTIALDPDDGLDRRRQRHREGRSRRP